MEDKNINAMIRQMMEASENGTLTIFVGAGVSKDAGLPSWGELIGKLKAEAGISENDYLKAAQMYYEWSNEKKGEDAYLKTLEKEVSVTSAPSKTHKLIFRAHPHNIITTNWDTLLETAAEQYNFKCNVVVCDDELCSASSDRKIVKMHGDFAHRNIVFKEDDYLKYSHNFPLIDNYVKTLLFTNTVLFIGYSYGDINVKQMESWISIHSKSKLPVYITLEAGSFDEHQRRYMERNNLIPILIDFAPEGKAGLTIDDLLEKIARRGKVEAVTLYSGEEVNFIADRLRPLDALDALLFDHVTRTLTNSFVVHEYITDGAVVSRLSFLRDLASGDYNEEVRQSYQVFLEKLRHIEDADSENAMLIFRVLRKALINGIAVNQDAIAGHGSGQFFELADNADNGAQLLHDVISFDYEALSVYDAGKLQMPEEMLKAYVCFQQEDYKGALDYTDRAIELLRKKKNYALLIAAWYNHNMAVWALKRLSFGFMAGNKEAEEIDIADQYSFLSETTKRHTKFVYDFVMGGTLSNMYSEMRSEQERKEATAQGVKNGGFSIDNDRARCGARFANLVHFIVCNCLFADKEANYAGIVKAALGIYLAQSVVSEKVSISMLYAYALIKWVRTDDLKRMLKEFCQRDSKRHLVMSETDAPLFVNEVFENIVKMYIKSDIVSSYEEYIENIYLLMGIIHLPDNLVSAVLDKSAYILQNKNSSYTFIESVNIFIALSHNVNGTVFDTEKVLDLIKILMQKLVAKRINGYEVAALQRGQINNLFACVGNGTARLNDKELVRQAVEWLKDKLPIAEKMNYAKGFVISLHDICDDECRALVDGFLLSVHAEAQNANVASEHNVFEADLYCYSLLLADRGVIEMDDTLADKIKDCLESALNRAGFASNVLDLARLAEYFAKTKQDSRFIAMQKTIDALRKKWESYKIPSIF